MFLFFFFEKDYLNLLFTGIFLKLLLFLNSVLLTSITSPAFPFEKVTITVQTVITPTEVEETSREALLAETDVRVIGPTILHILFGGVEFDGPGGADDSEGRDHPPEALIGASHIMGIHVGVAQKRETTSTTRGHFVFLPKESLRFLVWI